MLLHSEMVGNVKDNSLNANLLDCHFKVFFKNGVSKTKRTLAHDLQNIKVHIKL